MEYKSIAGPIGLIIEGNEDYEAAVRQYAQIIDKEAVGGWNFCWIQQIPVIKRTPSYGAMAFLGAILGVVGFFLGDGIGVAIIGAGVGGVIGYFIKDEKAEIFNMLIFSKEESSKLPKGITSAVVNNVESKKDSAMVNESHIPQLVDVVEDGWWRCLSCGMEQEPPREKCLECGTKFV